MRDSQKDKVYVWEQSQPWFTWNSYLTEDQILKATKKLDRNIPFTPIEGRFNIRLENKKTKIEFSSGRGASYANKRRIKLKREWALNYNVLFHEYSHNLAPRGEAHGRNFASIYCCLLVAFHPRQPSFKELAISLNVHKVDFKEFDYWWEKLKLSRRMKPFASCCEDALPVPIKKKRTSPKQRLIALCQEYDWLEYDDQGSDYFRVDVWDNRNEEMDDSTFDQMLDHSHSWKEAESYALKLIDQEV